MNTIFSLVAIVSLLALAFILSTDKKKIQLQTVCYGTFAASYFNFLCD